MTNEEYNEVKDQITQCISDAVKSSLVIGKPAEAQIGMACCYVTDLIKHFAEKEKK